MVLHMQCEVCGKDAELFTAVVEGTQLRVCTPCGRFGKILSRVTPPVLTKKQQTVHREPLQIEAIVSDYAHHIRSAREKRELTQQDFAKLIMIKESLLHKIETGQFEPPLDLARRLEKTLHLKLVEIREETSASLQKDDRPTGLTIGDILKLKG